MGVIKTHYAVVAAIFGIIELLGALGCIICTFFFTSRAQSGQLYSKYYHNSETRKIVMNAANYWWGGVPFLIPGILGLATVFNKNYVVMILFMLSNIVSCFCGIALAIVVGIFHVLFSIPVRAYADQRCTFTFNERQHTKQRTYCECRITGEDINTLDADRMRVYVQGCHEIDQMDTMLYTIIALSTATAFIAFICTYIGCIAVAKQDKNGPPRGKKGYNPAPFIQTQHPYNPPSQQQQPSSQQQQPSIAYQPQAKPERPQAKPQRPQSKPQQQQQQQHQVPDSYRPPPYQSQSVKQPARQPVADEPAGGDWL